MGLKLGCGEFAGVGRMLGGVGLGWCPAVGRGGVGVVVWVWWAPRRPGPSQVTPS